MQTLFSADKNGKFFLSMPPFFADDNYRILGKLWRTYEKIGVVEFVLVDP